MSLFGRRRRPAEQPAPYPVQNLRVLRADGQRIDLTTKDVGLRLTATRQSWQNDAWDYRDMIGELRYAHRLEARSVAKCRFFAAELRDYPDDPAELTGDDHDLDKQLAADAVDNLARLPLNDDPDGFIATMVENFATPGECWVHGQQDSNNELWAVRSVSEVTAHGDQIMLSELPGSTFAQRPLDSQREELLRCWIRHPRWGQLADSPLRAMLDTLEEIVLGGREVRAASRSRLAANGLLLLPDTLSLVRTREDEEELQPQSVEDDEFMGEFTAAVTVPIANEGHAGGMVPVVLRGSPEALKEVRHLRLDRDSPKEIAERLNGAVYRMLRGLDIQPERVEGMGGVNHWSAWQLAAEDIKHQVEPMAAIVAGCLTKAFLRPALKALQYSDEQIRKVVVWFDASELVENPNRGQDARDAHDRLVISDARFRQDLGYDDEDAPDEEELHRRIAAKTALDPGTAAVVLDLQRAMQQGGYQRGPRVIDAQRPDALPSGQAGSNGAHSAKPGETVPEKTVPEQRSPDGAGPGGMVAAAAEPDPMDGWRVDLDACRALGEVDAALLERILVAADAAIARAVERAGGRARNAARKDPALVAALDGVDVLLVAHTIGRDAVLAAVSLPDLLAGAYDRLRGQFRSWLDQAGKAAADGALRVLSLDRRSTAGRRVHRAITTRLEVHQDAAWITLAEALDAAAERALFAADPLTPEAGKGEDSGTLIEPAAVARALVIAGGGQPGRAGDGGLGTGPVLRGVFGDEGAVLLGHEWQYRPERIRDTFPPHLALDGTRFSTWTDPKLDTRPEHRRWLGGYYRPQDHAGCLCRAVQVLAVPEPDPDNIVLRRLREAQKSQRGQLAAEVAAEDTAAGRVGTSLQNEVEVRDRLAAGVERLRQHYIEGGGV